MIIRLLHCSGNNHRSDFRGAAIWSALVRRSGRNQECTRYAKFFSRSNDAVMRVYDDAGNVTETHEHAGDFKEV
jgi:hypothetical protein